MIEFHFKNAFVLQDITKYANWIDRIICSEGFITGQIDYIFCNDAYLLKLNEEYLNHNTFTDIITFDYRDGKTVSGDIFISTERVRDNAEKFNVAFINELRRVMSHGILHLVDYNDKSNEEKAIMRGKEDEKIKMFHVEQ
ncbi:rRNA maturation RNase YbeY [Allomuricauda sp. F6463D]|uniref:rRNA maturation RNase YbeY n=1 Tax=Allomuricauda sp. F6463D TaxID=2926409 RepID=UPI001FF4E249|nr:rRNA maturation RNase YbeY [Muricauda sp. F6463D]MCK0161218.1 rRNA maturation RNase YbeY [Muricauda sp. F6463D]